MGVDNMTMHIIIAIRISQLIECKSVRWIIISSVNCIEINSSLLQTRPSLNGEESGKRKAAHRRCHVIVCEETKEWSPGADSPQARLANDPAAGTRKPLGSPTRTCLIIGFNERKEKKKKKRVEKWRRRWRSCRDHFPLPVF